jgi:hypothetical protein
MAALTDHQIRDSLQQLYLDDPRPWLVGFSGGSPREMRPTNHDNISTAPVISRGKDSTLVAALVFDAVLAVPPAQRTKPVTVLCTDTRVDRNSHKRAQRTGSANGFSLFASNVIPRPWERERMSAGQVRADGEKPIHAERAGVRCRNSLSFRTRPSALRICPTRQQHIRADTRIVRWRSWANAAKATAHSACPTTCSVFSRTIWRNKVRSL